MTLQVYEFDPALFLTDLEAVEAYLAEALATGGPDEIEEARIVAARALARLGGPDAAGC